MRHSPTSTNFTRQTSILKTVLHCDTQLEIVNVDWQVFKLPSRLNHRKSPTSTTRTIHIIMSSAKRHSKTTISAFSSFSRSYTAILKHLRYLRIVLFNIKKQKIVNDDVDILHNNIQFQCLFLSSQNFNSKYNTT